MYIDNRILIGKNSKNSLYLLPKMANRHGIITGASGSGKTVTLKVLAESFSSAGVPVFLVDVKGDLASTSQVGIMNDNVKSRVESLDLKDFKLSSFPVTFFDVYGKNGHPIRTTISDIGARLLARMLNLTEAQEGILSIVFKIAEDEELELIDLKDLQKMLTYVGEKRQEYSLNYGNITQQSIGAIQRNLLVLEQDGGDYFFGKPDFELKDLRHFSSTDGRAYINILDAQALFKKPTLYATFLIWLLNDIYNNMPEVGDLEKPKLVLFFDEAHLLFSEMPNYVIKQITQIVKLIRSKGVGLYFISQSPSDVPDEILSQLGNKIQHVLRCYTPSDEKTVKAAANSFRSNPEFKTEEAIKSLATGEALISFLDEKGQPNIVERATVLPPQSLMGAIDDLERQKIIKGSFIYDKYENKADPESAFEKIEEIKEEEEKQKEELEKKATVSSSKKTTSKKSTNKSNKYVNKLANSTVNTLGRKLGNKIFKSLFK